MKTYQIESWISLRRFTAGRRAFAARRLKEAADKSGLSAVSALCDQVIGNEKRLLRLQQEWRNTQSAPTGTWPKEVLELDVTLDRLVVQLRDLLAAIAAAFASSNRGRAAQMLLDKYFANGVTYYTQCIVEEEAERVGQLLDALDGHAAELDAATVKEVVADTRARHGEYATLVEKVARPPRTAFETVRQVDLTNQRLFLEAIAQVLVETAKAPDPLGQRQLLLQVVAEQDADISAAIRAKRKVKDVDPDSGEPADDLVTPVTPTA